MRDIDLRIKQLSRVSDLELTERIIARIFEQSKDNVLYIESGALSEMDEGAASSSAIISHENIMDVVGNPPAAVDVGRSFNSMQGQHEVLSIQDFFARPIQIFKSPILLGNNLDTFLRVWDLYTLNPAIRAKLRNYAYFRGNLHITVFVTGTPFHYGKLLLSYQPYDRFNETITSYLVSLTYNNDCRSNFMSYLSQAPGAITLDMKDNQPIEIKCPFISTKPMHRLYNNSASAISDVTSFVDLYNAGALYITTLNTPGAVSDSSSNLSMYVYAHMTDVELGTSTASIVQVTTESGMIPNDEYKTGPVEMVSTKLAEISGVLTKVPEIAPYAYASKMLFSGISKFAAIYGWSKPPNDSQMKYVKAIPFPNSAQCIGFSSDFKISLDPKQELTVDPRACASSRDEMTIAHIASVESFWTKFVWHISDVSMTPVFNTLVSPWMVSVASHGTPTRKYVQPTALAFAAQPFFYWRGDLEYRFDFVCSAFHRGKIAFYYEPNIYQSTLIEASLSINKQFLAIVDIQETQSVRIQICWASSRAWLKVGAYAKSSTWETITSMLPLDPGFFNGCLFAVPLTRLTSPLEKDIDVNVWVSSPNIQFNTLTDQNMPAERRVFTESGSLNPISDTTICLNKSSAQMNSIFEEHFGENPISFRLLMKRYAPVPSVNTTTSAGNIHFLTFTYNNIPRMASNYSTGASNGPVINLFDYLRYAYLGVRGGVKRRFRCVQSFSPSNNTLVSVNNVNPSVAAADSVADSTTVDNYNTSLLGTVLFQPNINCGIDYEIPFYTNNLFVFSFSNTLDGGQNTTDDDMEVYWQRTHTLNMYVTVATTQLNIHTDIATGEDFTFLRFGGAPYFSHT